MKIIASILFLTAMLMHTSINQNSSKDIIDLNQYQLKATFLLRFINYINWKDYSPEKPFEIAILEDNPIVKALHGTKNPRKITVTIYNNLDDINFCNILFVPSNSQYKLESILSKFAGKPVLIITEKNGYGKRGSHINFIIVDEKLKFEVNLKSINKSGLEVSSFLLQHAVIIQ